MISDLHRRGRLVVAVATALAVVVGGCSTATAPVAATGPGGPVVADGHGWTPAGLSGPDYSAETCSIRWATLHGVAEPLPDPQCTPGALDAAVFQGDIASTICRRGGYTSGVRPPFELTGPAKRRAMTAYGISGPAGAYEFDHLIPLELGGASDTRNLWPEPDVGGSRPKLRNDKDQVENDLHAAVCSASMSLVAAQRAISANWTTADRR